MQMQFVLLSVVMYLLPDRQYLWQPYCFLFCHGLLNFLNLVKFIFMKTLLFY